MIRHTLMITAAMIGCGDSTGSNTGVVPGENTAPGTFALSEIASGLNNPLYLTAPAGDPRLFVVEKAGRIRIIKNGTLLPTPFLDITSKVSTGSEQGLLSVAFHPSYSSNGFLYVNYTNTSGDTRVERYTVSGNADVANPATAKTILAIDQPFSNHNGGLNLFGPDGYLYVGMGDGGGVGETRKGMGRTRTLCSESFSASMWTAETLTLFLRTTPLPTVEDGRRYGLMDCGIHGDSPSTKPRVCCTSPMSGKTRLRRSTSLPRTVPV